MHNQHGQPAYNRRLGSRVPIDGAELNWVPVVARKTFRRKLGPQTAILVDLSITGARVQAPSDSRVVVGTPVAVEVGGGRGFVRVRRIDPGTSPDEAFYGVEFVELDAVLTELVHDTLAARRPEDLVWRWKYSS